MDDTPASLVLFELVGERERQTEQNRLSYLCVHVSWGGGVEGGVQHFQSAPPLFLETQCYNCRPVSDCVLLSVVRLFLCVCVSVSVSDYIMVPASEDAANERVCLRHCALFGSGYRDAPVTERHGNRKWAGHLAHQ